MISPVTETKYPIICSPMNGVSDVKLAVACYNAGILPSLVPYCYTSLGFFDINLFEYALKTYSTKTNNGPILIALEVDEFQNPEMFDILTRYNVKFVEVLDSIETKYQAIYELSQKAKSFGIHTVPKITGGFNKVRLLMENRTFEYVSLKGPKGAGRGEASIVLEDEVVKIKEQFPNLKIIVSGGINTSQDIKRFKDLGADGFSLGTIFSASTESSIRQLAKEKIVNATSSDLQRLSTGARQNSLIFSQVEESDMNNTDGLVLGTRTGNSGHIFLGSGVDYINSIRDVKDIVTDLVKDL